MNKLTTCRNPHSSHQSLYRMDRNSNFPIANPYGSEENGWRSHNTMLGSYCKLISDHSLAPMFETRSRAMFDYPGMADKGLGSLKNNSIFLQIALRTAIWSYLLILTERMKLSVTFELLTQTRTFSRVHASARAYTHARSHTCLLPFSLASVTANCWPPKNGPKAARKATKHRDSFPISDEVTTWIIY